MTILVPDYRANRARRLADAAIAALGFDMEFDHTVGLDVIVIKGRIEELPSPLRIVKFSKFIIVKNNSPLTKAVDGLYHEIFGENLDHHVMARVETYVRSSVLQQHIRVWGPRLDMVNLWFDELVAGKKNDKCVNPVSLPEQPLNLQVLDAIDRARQVADAALNDQNLAHDDYWWPLSDVRNILANSPGLKHAEAGYRLVALYKEHYNRSGGDVLFSYAVRNLLKDLDLI
jgi:hypothetical protein